MLSFVVAGAPARGSRSATHAEVAQRAPWVWTIDIMQGILRWGPSGGPFAHIGNRASAERRARRLMKQWLRKSKQTNEHLEVSDRGREILRALEELRAPEAAWEKDFRAAVDENRA